MEKHQVKYANQVIDFVVKRKQVKNVNLHVKPDMTVEVTANEQVPLDFIYDFVESKGSWILKQVKQFEGVQPFKRSKREYVSGESFKYLGKQYRLRVEQAAGEEFVKYFRGFLYLYVKDVDNYSRKAKLIDEWYREKAKKTFQESLDKM